MDQIQGIVVNEVAPDGPAAQAGIQVNDLIISVNNKPAVSALETMDRGRDSPWFGYLSCRDA